MEENEWFIDLVRGNISASTYRDKVEASKFVKGARVRATKNDSWLRAGNTGTVICKHPGGAIGVEWDSYNSNYCHTLDDRLRERRGWYTPVRCLELEEE